MIKQTTTLPVSLLLNYREFDRVTTPAPFIPFISSEYNTVDSLTEKIAKEGIQSAVELSVYNGTVLLTEGNHRVSCYSRLDFDVCPVTITFYETSEEFNNTFHAHTVNRMKPIGVSMKVELINIVNGK